MRREPPWRKQKPDKDPVIAHGTVSRAWEGVSGAIQDDLPVPFVVYDNAPQPKRPPWGSPMEAARDLGGSVTYHEGTRVTLKVPVGHRRVSRGYSHQEPTTYTGVVDPELIDRFVTEEGRLLMLVEAEADKRVQKQLDRLKDAVTLLEKRVKDLENWTGCHPREY